MVTTMTIRRTAEELEAGGVRPQEGEEFSCPGETPTGSLLVVQVTYDERGDALIEGWG